MLSLIPWYIAKYECNIKLRQRLATKLSSYIYFGVDAFGDEIAFKTQTIRAAHPWLRNEIEVYNILKGGDGIPQIKCYGCERGYHFLAMEKLGPSLKDLFKRCSHQFSVKTVIMLAEQMLDRLEFIHSRGIIHCDIRPNHFVMGVGQHYNKVYMIDFNEAKKFRGSNDSAPAHVSSREDKYRTGTPRYESVNAYLGLEQSRRDDLVSLGYMLLFLLRGSLPWQGIKAYTFKQKLERIYEKKRSTPVEVLCEGCPAEFAVYLNYCRSLRFGEDPNYNFLRQLFQNVFRSKSYQHDYMFDWVIMDRNKLCK